MIYVHRLLVWVYQQSFGCISWPITAQSSHLTLELSFRNRSPSVTLFYEVDVGEHTSRYFRDQFDASDVRILGPLWRLKEVKELSFHFSPMSNVNTTPVPTEWIGCSESKLFWDGKPNAQSYRGNSPSELYCLNTQVHKKVFRIG